MQAGCAYVMMLNANSIKQRYSTYLLSHLTQIAIFTLSLPSHHDFTWRLIAALYLIRGHRAQRKFSFNSQPIPVLCLNDNECREHSFRSTRNPVKCVGRDDSNLLSKFDHNKPILYSTCNWWPKRDVPNFQWPPRILNFQMPTGFWKFKERLSGTEFTDCIYPTVIGTVLEHNDYAPP